jgi:hypothetical protein
VTCIDCTEAAKRPWHGFRFGCQECAARAISRGPNFRRCRDAGRLDRKYQAELDLLGCTHDQVKAAYAADKERITA